MTITYVANVRMPTERAHGAQIAKTCEALERMGADVMMVVPKRRNSLTESTEAYYQLHAALPITYVPVLDIVAWGKFGFLLESFSFARAARKVVAARDGVVYGRDEWPLMLLVMFGIKHAVWESHTGAWNFAARYLVRRIPVVVISEGLKRLYIEKGVPKERLVVAHDGVDVAAFAPTERKVQARARLGLPEGKKAALYIGSFGEGKGTDTFFKAAALVEEVVVAVIGGSDAEVAQAKKKYPQVHFVGARPYAELANNAAAADMLVLPNSGKDTVSAQYTSPLKLFAYMAAKVPIVASDLLSVREVLDDECAYLVAPDSPSALAAGMRAVLRDMDAAHRKALAAYERVLMYDWRIRAGKIIAFIKATNLLG